jgi:hypothetical protein
VASTGFAFSLYSRSASSEFSAIICSVCSRDSRPTLSASARPAGSTCFAPFRRDSSADCPSVGLCGLTRDRSMRCRVLPSTIRLSEPRLRPAWYRSLCDHDGAPLVLRIFHCPFPVLRGWFPVRFFLLGGILCFTSNSDISGAFLWCPSADNETRKRTSQVTFRLQPRVHQ